MRRSRSAGWTELSRLQDRLHRLIEEALTGVGAEVEGGVATGWRPPIDLVEIGDAFLLYVELPGMSREAVRLEAGDRWVEISGERSTRPDASFLRLEGGYGPFRRRVELPDEIDGDAIDAKLEKGLLEIRVPKAQRSRRATVEIREG